MFNSAWSHCYAYRRPWATLNNHFENDNFVLDYCAVTAVRHVQGTYFLLQCTTPNKAKPCPRGVDLMLTNNVLCE